MNKTISLKMVNGKFPPENDDFGNIEYKKRLHPNSLPSRIDKLITQTRWRMEQGYEINGSCEAYYYIGINDDGTVGGLKINDLADSITIFKKIIDRADAKIVKIKFFCLKSGHFAKIKIQSSPKKNQYTELRVGFFGPSGCGKSSLIGYLSYGVEDDGNGNSRGCVFRHFHEYDNGETSSIKNEIIGFKNGKINNFLSGFVGSWKDIIKDSTKIINLIDTPGNFKYFKTSLFSLTTQNYDYIILMIQSNWNEQQMNLFNFHLYLCKSFDIKPIIIINKIDLVDNTDATSTIIQEMASSLGYNGCIELNDTCNDIDVIQLMDQKYIPTIKLSIVSRKNMNIIYNLLLSLKPHTSHAPHDTNKLQKSNNDDNGMFMIYDVINISDLGNVVIGKMMEGKIKIGMQMLIGPINKSFYDVKINSIHKKQISQLEINNVDTGSILVEIDDNLINHQINKHMFIMSPDKIKYFINEFYIVLDDTFIIKHNELFSFVKTDLDKIKKNAKLMIYSNNVYSMIQINEIISTPDKIILKVNFLNDEMNYVNHNSKIALMYQPNMVFGNTFLSIDEIE
jgi:GTPase